MGNGSGEFSGILGAIEFPEIPQNNEAKARVDRLCGKLNEAGIKTNTFIAKYFYDPQLYEAMPVEIRESDEELAAYLANCMAFGDLIPYARKLNWSGDHSGLLGEVISIP